MVCTCDLVIEKRVGKTGVLHKADRLLSSLFVGMFKHTAAKSGEMIRKRFTLYSSLYHKPSNVIIYLYVIGHLCRILFL